jgi:hypothetical protein
MSLLHLLMMSSKVLVATWVLKALATLLGCLFSPFHLEIDSSKKSRDKGRGFVGLPQPLVTTPKASIETKNLELQNFRCVGKWHELGGNKHLTRCAAIT